MAVVLRYLFWLWLDVSTLSILVTQVTPAWHGHSPCNNVEPHLTPTPECRQH